MRFQSAVPCTAGAQCERLALERGSGWYAVPLCREGYVTHFEETLILEVVATSVSP